MVRSFLEMLPLLSLALLAVTQWDEALALFGMGPEAADFSLQRKAEPWPRAYLLGAMAAGLLFNVAPLLEEAWRCWKARRGSR